MSVSPSRDPYHALLASVIVQAHLDLLHKTPAIRADAEAFVADRVYEAFCAALDLDPERGRTNRYGLSKAHLVKARTPRKAPRELSL